MWSAAESLDSPSRLQLMPSFANSKKNAWKTECNGRYNVLKGCSRSRKVLRYKAAAAGRGGGGSVNRAR
jgi:hypothetical protein